MPREMYRWSELGNPFGKLNNLTAAILVFLAGALIYHFVVNMRRGK